MKSTLSLTPLLEAHRNLSKKFQTLAAEGRRIDKELKEVQSELDAKSKEIVDEVKEITGSSNPQFYYANHIYKVTSHNELRLDEGFAIGTNGNELQ